MAIRITSTTLDHDTCTEGVGGVFDRSECEFRVIGEVEGNVNHSATLEQGRATVVVDEWQRDRVQFKTTDPDRTSTRRIVLLLQCFDWGSEILTNTSPTRPSPAGARDVAPTATEPLPLKHRLSPSLSRLSSFPSLAGRRQMEHPDFPWSGGATTVPEAVSALEFLFCLHGGPRRRSRPRAPVGPSQPRRPGPLHRGGADCPASVTQGALKGARFTAPPLICVSVLERLGRAG